MNDGVKPCGMYRQYLQFRKGRLNIPVTAILFAVTDGIGFKCSDI